MPTSSSRLCIIDMRAKRRDAWFLVIWRTIWRLWRSDSFNGRPDRGLLSGELRFLRSPRVPKGILVICEISER